MAQVKVGQFDIPDEMAKELSELLSRKTILEDVLVGVAMKKDMDAFDNLAKELYPTIEGIEAIKHKITAELVPDEFKTDKYIWNYDGYAIAGPTIFIYENQ